MISWIAPMPGPSSRERNLACGSRLPRRAGLWLVAAWIILATLPIAPVEAKSRTEHLVYFPHTPYELNIYKIHGRQPGATLMIIGGIQGDEPGGFLSADLYADMALERGDLIVVPRANFNSILQFKRGVNGDMNRRFAGNSGSDMEDQIVAVLKSLIAESSCLLNLHEGSGFYSPQWEGPEVNPLRYGQSVIADAERFYSPRQQQWLDLQAMAERVIAQVNPQIREPGYRFRFNNHRTAEPDSLHAEQRKSATYYALTNEGIPAFGIETSKALPSTEMRVFHHRLIINAFMNELGIVPEIPPVSLEPPSLSYLVIAVNDGLPVVVGDQQSLHLRPGDRIEIAHIEANYERGLSADILGVGSMNDLRKSFVISADTDIVVRKDHLACGHVHLAVDAKTPNRPAAPVSESNTLGFIVRVNGRQYYYENGGRALLVLGDRFEVVDVVLPKEIRGRVTVNVRGYVNDPLNNTGEDRGCLIDTGKDLLRRYSVDREGRHYLVLVESDREIGRLHLMLEPPQLHYLVACIDGKEKRWYRAGETIQVGRQQTLQVMDIKGNTAPEEALGLECSEPAFNLGSAWREKVLRFADLFDKTSAADDAPASFSWTVKRGDFALGQVFVEVAP
jgi:Carboxypeptidase controlling helical cell shape catalytic